VVTRFVDRDAELSRLLELCERGFYPVLYVYGPEGCGKTRLVKELIDRVAGRGSYVAIYVDAQSVSSLEEAVFGPPEVVRVVAEAVGSVVGGLGAAVARVLPYAVRKALERSVRGRRVVVVVDDVARPLGLEAVEGFAKKLLDLVEWLLTRGAASVLAIATTSEGASLEALWRHNYVYPTLLWNLPRRGFEELAHQLDPPSEEVVEEAWRLTGGNPRMLIEIARGFGWSIDTWFRRRVVDRVEALCTRVRAEGLEEHLRLAIEDPDHLLEARELYRLLLEENLVLYKRVATLAGTYVEPDHELGIGRYIAWQTPAHRLALKTVLENR